MGDVVQAAQFLDQCSADLLVVDLREEQIQSQLTSLRVRFPTIPIVIIAHPASGALAVDGSLGIKTDANTVSDFAKIVELANADPERTPRNGDSGAPPMVRSKEIARAIAFLESNYWHDDISLDLVAREAYMSRFHFSRMFRRETGMRYIDYLTDLRVKRSCTLLLETDRTITEICLEVGYNDLTHFERMFRKRFGQTPSELRRGERQSARLAALSHPHVMSAPLAPAKKRGVT